MIDRSILKKASKQNRKGQYLLYNACYGELFQITCRYFQNEEDRMAALNAGFLKILDALPEFLKENEHERFLYWAKRIVINSCIDAYRKDKRMQKDTKLTDWQEEQLPVDQFALNEAESRMSKGDIEQLIFNLTPIKRQVFNLYAIDGYSHKEIAVQLSITEGNSRYHLSQARKRLQDMLLNVINTEKSFLL
jgi:RNA polymerase sigma factor (sigma-70 family)